MGLTNRGAMEECYFEWSTGHTPDSTLRERLTEWGVSTKLWQKLLKERNLRPEVLDMTYKEARKNPRGLGKLGDSICEVYPSNKEKKQLIWIEGEGGKGHKNQFAVQTFKYKEADHKHIDESTVKTIGNFEEASDWLYKQKHKYAKGKIENYDRVVMILRDYEQQE